MSDYSELRRLAEEATPTAPAIARNRFAKACDPTAVLPTPQEES